MGLHGVDTCLASKNSDGFDSHILHHYASLTQLVSVPSLQVGSWGFESLRKYQCSISLVVKRGVANAKSRVRLSYIAPVVRIFYTFSGVGSTSKNPYVCCTDTQSRRYLPQLTALSALPVNSQFPEIIKLVVIRESLNKYNRCHEANGKIQVKLSNYKIRLAYPSGRSSSGKWSEMNSLLFAWPFSSAHLDGGKWSRRRISVIHAIQHAALRICLSTSVEKVPSSVLAGDAFSPTRTRSFLRSVRSMKGVSLDAQSSTYHTLGVASRETRVQYRGLQFAVSDQTDMYEHEQYAAPAETRV